jgi:hypothetical protein
LPMNMLSEPFIMLLFGTSLMAIGSCLRKG